MHLLSKTENAIKGYQADDCTSPPVVKMAADATISGKY